MKSGDRFRITVQLIHAAADQHLWAETYEGAISDILDVQARVARDIAAGVRAELSHDERARLTTLRTVHPQAYSLYLKGRYNARILTEDGQRKAIRYFRDSIQSDPHDAIRLLLRIRLCRHCRMFHRARLFLRDGAEAGVRGGGSGGR